MVGVPSDDNVKSTQTALQNVESLAANPRLFDSDLSMKLSQHLFNLQFARYIHESSQGHFAPEAELEPEEHCPKALQPTQILENEITVPPQIPDSRREEDTVPQTEKVFGTPSELYQLGETMKEIKGVLENTNRVLMLIKNDQSTVGCVGKYYHVYKDPLNQQGVAASECGLPRFRYGYYQDGPRYSMYLHHDLVVGYLKFFGIGAELIDGDKNPKLIDGKFGEAEKLLLRAAGLGRY